MKLTRCHIYQFGKLKEVVCDFPEGITLIQGNPDLSITFTHRVDGAEKRLSTDEMREMLGEEVPLNDPAVLGWVREYLNEPMEET